MSASSEEDYHSAEEEGGASDATRLSRGLEGARLSENDGDDGALGHAAGSSSGEQTELRGTTEPHVINRTPASNEEEASSDHGEGGAEKSASPSERETQELTEEEIMERKEQAGRLKAEGNDTFKRGEYASAIQCYTDAIEQYPASGCTHEVAICYANRAACHLKLEDHQSVVDDCSKALELKEDYLKAYARRAQAHEAMEKYEDALEDYKKVLELDPSHVAARRALMYLPEKIKEQQEKLKAEMLGKLKELGNAVLNPFGLSTDNFQFQQDPNTGGYSMNFKR
jgi:tetratricopeptide (TPR) repeat protein